MKYGLIIIGLAGLLVGCAGQKPVEQPMCVEAIAKDKLMASAEQTLLSLQFAIEKYDVDAGVIRTRPLRGGQFFEPWRGDNAGKFNTAEANVQSIERTVEITIAAEPTRMCMTCAATVRRLSLPDEPMRGYLGAPALHTDSDKGTQRLEVDKSRLDKMQWIELGRDTALENKIFSQIQKRLVKGVK